MNSSIFFLLAAVLIVAGLLLLVMSRLHRGTSQLDTDKYRRRWLDIERQLNRDDHRSCQFAVVEADKLLDLALKERGMKGETMGDRLKYAKGIFSSNDATWGAHKLRNQIVHESGVNVDYETARRALAGFKRALKDVGAI